MHLSFNIIWKNKQNFLFFFSVSFECFVHGMWERCHDSFDTASHTIHRGLLNGKRFMHSFLIHSLENGLMTMGDLGTKSHPSHLTPFARLSSQHLKIHTRKKSQRIKKNTCLKKYTVFVIFASANGFACKTIEELKLQWNNVGDRQTACVILHIRLWVVQENRHYLRILLKIFFFQKFSLPENKMRKMNHNLVQKCKINFKLQKCASKQWRKRKNNWLLVLHAKMALTYGSSCLPTKSPFIFVKRIIKSDASKALVETFH